MSWRITQTASRDRYLAKCGPEEAARYDAWMNGLSREVEEASLAELGRLVELQPVWTPPTPARLTAVTGWWRGSPRERPSSAA